MLDRPAYGIAIGALQVVHDRVVPFMDSFFKQCAGEHRRNQHRENERSKERKGHSPGHRMEQAPLDTLQGEDRQVCRDDDGNREKDRALDLVSGVANALHGRPVIATTMAHMADDVLHHDHGAVHHHAEIQCAEGQQVRGNALQLETRRCKQQRKGNRESYDHRTADIPQKQKENDHDENDAFREIVQHGMRRVMDQVAAVDERNDLHARR